MTEVSVDLQVTELNASNSSRGSHVWRVETPDGAAGDESVRPLPDLKAHRTACRLILLALESGGSPPLKEWLALPAPFDDLQVS